MTDFKLSQKQLEVLERAKRDYELMVWVRGEPDDRIITCVQTLGHHPIHIQHNIRGSENTDICDICKIYWKYDCSD